MSREPDALLDLVVVEKTTLATDVVTVALRRLDGRPLPQWAPGAHVDLLLPDRPDGAPVRQYSLCGRPQDRDVYRIAVLRDGTSTGAPGTSQVVHDRLAVGDRVQVRGPRNHFPLEPAPSYLFLAGGIGITPLLPMVRAAAAEGADWRLVYCGRSRDSMAFADELAAYGNRVVLHTSGDRGPLDLDAVLAPVPGRHVYCCGPERLLCAVEERLASTPGQVLHAERFAPREVDRPTREFAVVLEERGLTLPVPRDVSVLSVLEQAGVLVPTSCGEGTCGSCEVGVLDGVPDHRDSVLSEAERAANDCLLVCVSRALTPTLVLEL